MKPKKIEITGLRKRWLISSLSPILVVLLLVAGTFCAGMANYYYNMMLDGLKTRATHASDYFNSYSMNSYASFYQAAATYTEEFAEKDRLELQFISTSGRIILSSYGLTSGLSPGTPEIETALQTGEITPYRGVDPLTGEHIMALSAPLLFNGRPVGVMRYVTSMAAVQREILVTVGVAVGILLLCLVMVYVSNMVFINNVVEPVAEVTETAKRIAGGSYGTQMENHYRDEIGQLIDAINDMSSQISPRAADPPHRHQRLGGDPDGRHRRRPGAAAPGGGDHPQGVPPPDHHGGGAAGLLQDGGRALHPEHRAGGPGGGV